MNCFSPDNLFCLDDYRGDIRDLKEKTTPVFSWCFKNNIFFLKKIKETVYYMFREDKKNDDYFALIKYSCCFFYLADVIHSWLPYKTDVRPVWLQIPILLSAHTWLIYVQICRICYDYYYYYWFVWWRVEQQQIKC